jgi:hypothetical protein
MGPTAARAGPCELDAIVGRGGMGEVWRGRHATLGHEVAVKVVSAEHASDPIRHRAFRNEVRAMSSLDHPNIVAVLDQGVVHAEAAGSAGGRLVAGSPWIAMEYAAGGSLVGRRTRLHWSTVRALLLALVVDLATGEWPGNVREPYVFVERAVIEAGDGDPIDLPASASTAPRAEADPDVSGPAEPPPSRAPRPSADQRVERLRAVNGNVRALARSLGVSRNSVYRWMQEDGVKPERS